MKIINASQVKPFSTTVVHWILALYVVYGVLMWEVALNIKYYYIILSVFLILNIYIYISLKSKNQITTFTDIFKNIFNYIKVFDAIVFLFLISNCVWIFVVPRLKGFSTSLAIQESGILLILILYFPLAILIRMKEIDFRLILKSFAIITSVLAVWYVLIWSAEVCFPGAYQGFFDFLKNVPGHLFKVGDVYKGWSSVRIVLANCILLVSGLLFTINKKQKYTIFDYLMIIIFTFAILCTYLKSIWLGLIIGILILAVSSLIQKEGKNANIWKAIITISISFIVLNFTVFGGSTFTRLFNGFSTSSHQATLVSSGVQNKAESGSTKVDKKLLQDNKIISDTAASNTEKLVQIKKLTNQWKQSPFIGFGYGSYIKDYLRSPTVVYAYEMTAFSLLMKVGIVGALFWLLLLFAPYLNIYRNYRDNKIGKNRVALWIAVALAFIVSIQTNPLLFTASSMNLILILILYSVDCESRESIKAD